MKKLIMLIVVIAGGIPMVSCSKHPEFEKLDNTKATVPYEFVYRFITSDDTNRREKRVLNNT